ncbi:MAG TPA: hypothetical protein PK922_14475, partial [Syntrophorhabdus sp.]|nr:hypothetical protein [Syntrophorhabdus sp.]
EDEKNTPAVRMVVEELVPMRNYECFEIKEVNWGISVKMKYDVTREQQWSTADNVRIKDDQCI